MAGKPGQRMEQHRYQFFQLYNTNDDGRYERLAISMYRKRNISVFIANFKNRNTYRFYAAYGRI